MNALLLFIYFSEIDFWVNYWKQDQTATKIYLTTPVYRALLGIGLFYFNFNKIKCV